MLKKARREAGLLFSAERHKNGGVIRGLRQIPRLLVNTGVFDAVFECIRDEQQVDTQSHVFLKSRAAVIPPGLVSARALNEPVAVREPEFKQSPVGLPLGY